MPQNFRDQFTAMRQVCEQLGLQLGQLEQGAWAILKKKGVTNPTSEQLDDTKKQAAEENHTILFLYLSDQQRYGKAIEDMEKNILNKLDPFPKTISEACRYLIKWCNNYGGRHLPLSVMTRKSLKKAERKRKSHASDVQRWAISTSECEEELPKKLQRKG